MLYKYGNKNDPIILISSSGDEKDDQSCESRKKEKIFKNYNFYRF